MPARPGTPMVYIGAGRRRLVPSSSWDSLWVTEGLDLPLSWRLEHIGSVATARLDDCVR